MNKQEEILNNIRGGLIVSCQALEDEPLHSSYIMARMAYSAMQGGASGIRANSAEDIREIKKAVSLPIIGIIKKEYKESSVYITPTMKEVDELVECETDIIAIDATNRIRPEGKKLEEFFAEVREKYPNQLFMADCSCIEEGVHAEKIGFDIIGTTMSGYTPYTKGTSLPDFDMMRSLVSQTRKPIIAEGGIWSTDELVKVLNTGVLAAVIGTAITRPREITRRYVDAVAKSNTNLGFTNSGRYQGDNDGPAYVVYSKIGYNKAGFEFHMSQIKLNMRRKSDQRWTNSYIFLGVDVYDEKEEFLNCIDAGFCYSGGVQNWHLFYNLLRTNQEKSWYESPIALDDAHDYKLILDCSYKDDTATLTIIDITAGNRTVDSAEFEVMYAKKDGSNLSMYQDYAIDFPDDIKKNQTRENSTDDWEEITLYNTDEGIYLNNIVIHDAKLYSPDGEYTWSEGRTNDHFMWPSTQFKKIDYACTKIRKQEMNSELILDLDMNH
jgi:N-acylglucosamine-6-phosphate 2-epimerase